MPVRWSSVITSRAPMPFSDISLMASNTEESGEIDQMSCPFFSSTSATVAIHAPYFDLLAAFTAMVAISTESGGVNRGRTHEARYGLTGRDVAERCGGGTRGIVGGLQIRATFLVSCIDTTVPFIPGLVCRHNRFVHSWVAVSIQQFPSFLGRCVTGSESADHHNSLFWATRSRVRFPSPAAREKGPG